MIQPMDIYKQTAVSNFSVWYCVLPNFPLCYTADLDPMSPQPDTALDSAHREAFSPKETKH